MLTKENASYMLLSFRCEHKKTQEHVADKTGVSVQTISQIENGQIKSPQAMTLFKLNNYIGLFKDKDK